MNKANLFQEKWVSSEKNAVVIRQSDEKENDWAVCEVPPGKNQKEFVKLIASAPDLLRACNFVLQGIKRGTIDDLAFRILEDAIFEATGELK